MTPVMNRVKAVAAGRRKRGARGTMAQAAENRDRIIAAAARAFRERGFDGIGVAGLMRSVGLTHGGFYGHFASKEELMALACRRAVDDMLATGGRAPRRHPATGRRRASSRPTSRPRIATRRARLPDGGARAGRAPGRPRRCAGR